MVRTCRALYVFLFLVVAGSRAGLAAEWRAAIDVGEIYTNNLTLADDAAKEDAWVTRIEPSVGLTINAARLDLDLDYSLEGLFYADDSDRNGLFSTLSTDALYSLIGDELWLTGKAVIDQVNVNPQKSLTSSNVNITGNRSDAVIWNIGPIWKRSLFTRSEIDASFLAGRVNYEQEAAQDVKTMSAAAAVRNSTANPGDIGYELKYEFEKLDYEISGDVEVQSLYLQLGYQANRALQLHGLVGLDSDFTDRDDSSLSESRWEAGLSSRLGKNEFDFSVGERFWGSTYYLEWNRRESDRFRMRVAYNESPSTTDIVELRRVPTGEDEIDIPDSGLERPGSARRFIRKRGDAGLNWVFTNSTLYLGLFLEQRDYVEFESDLTPVPDEDAYGVTASFSRQLGYKTMLNLAVSGTERELIVEPTTPTGLLAVEDDSLLQASAGIDYEWGTRTFLFFEVRYNDRSAATAGLGNYEELAAEIGLTREF